MIVSYHGTQNATLRFSADRSDYCMHRAHCDAVRAVVVGKKTGCKHLRLDRCACRVAVIGVGAPIPQTKHG